MYVERDLNYQFIEGLKKRIPLHLQGKIIKTSLEKKNSNGKYLFEIAT